MVECHSGAPSFSYEAEQIILEVGSGMICVTHRHRYISVK